MFEKQPRKLYDLKMWFKFQIQAGFLAVVLCVSGPSVALVKAAGLDAFGSCVHKAAAYNLDAKSQFRTALRDLIVATKPEFKALANISMKLQISFAKKQAARLRFLTLVDAGRIVTDKGVSKFTSFNWSKDDEADLVKKDGKYKNLVEKTVALQAQNDGYSEWPQVRKFFRAELATSPAYKILLLRLTVNRNELRHILSGCPR